MVRQSRQVIKKKKTKSSKPKGDVKPTKVKKTITKERKKRRHKSGTCALQKIKRLQKRTDFMFTESAISNISRNHAFDLGHPGQSFKKEALNVLQTFIERMAGELFKPAQRIACANKRSTVKERDIVFALEECI